MTDSLRAVFLPTVRRDIQEVVRWSERNFGRAAAERYSVLIDQALRDIFSDPKRLGTKERSDLAPGACVYHLVFSRDRVEGKRVRTPRHFVLYRVVDAELQFARLLHDSRDLGRHVPPDLER